MNQVQNKIDIIRKVLSEIESENRFTEIFRQIPLKLQRDFKDFSPEQIYFDFIKYIIEQDNLPDNVYGINIHMNSDNVIDRYELISFACETASCKGYINVVWAE